MTNTTRVHATGILRNMVHSCEYKYYACNNKATRLIPRVHVLNDSTHAAVCEACYQHILISIRKRNRGTK